MRKIKYRYEYCLTILLISGFFIYQINSTNYHFNSPDEVILKSFTENYQKTGNMYYKISETNFNQYARLRGTYIFQDKIVPLKFIGFPYLFGSMTTLIPEVLPFLTPILGVLLILVVFLISNIIYHDKKISILVSTIIIFLPFFWYWANHAFFENVSSVFFFLLGFYYLIKITKYQKLLSNYILAGIFFGVACSIRYDIALLIICFATPMLIFHFKKINWKYILPSVILLIIILSPIFLISKEIYGNYLYYGSKVMYSSINYVIVKDINNVFLYFDKVIVFFPFILLTIISLILAIKQKNDDFKLISIGLIIYSILFSYIFISEYPLSHPNILHESYTRYFLSFFIISILVIGGYLKFIKNKKVFSLLVFSIIIFSITSTIPILKSQWDSSAYYKAIAEDIVNNTADNSYILLGGSDKFLYAQRNVIPITNFNDYNESINYTLMADVVKEINDKNKIYLYNDNMDFDKIRDSLNSLNISLITINSSNNLYEIHST